MLSSDATEDRPESRGECGGRRGGASEDEAGGGQRPGHMQEFGLYRKSIKKGETSLAL